MADQETWQKIANQTTRKVNLGWWFQVLATPLLITSLLIACAILIIRREVEVIPWLQLSLASAAILLITGVSCWIVARKKFETRKQSLVRIESAMRLRTALTAAEHGITSWPRVPELINDGVRWNWKRLLTPLIGSAVILTCGLLIPIHAKSDLSVSTPQPTAWNDLNASIDQLDNQEVVQKEYLEEMRKKLEELRAQSPDEWFSHASLEATDHLQQNHDSEQNNLGNNLNRAERALNSLQNSNGHLTGQQKQRLLNEYDQALQKIQQGGMQPNKKLLQQLQKINPQDLKQLSPEQLNQLRENMRNHAQKIRGKGKQPGGNDDDWLDNEGEGEEQGDGDGKPGRGGINRGPGTAPRVLGKPHDDTGTGKHQGLKSGDLSNALPGDLLQTSDAQHNVDRSSHGPTAGGTSEAKGKGGDRVWKDSLMPNEKKALKKFFE